MNHFSLKYSKPLGNCEAWPARGGPLWMSTRTCCSLKHYRGWRWWRRWSRTRSTAGGSNTIAVLWAWWRTRAWKQRWRQCWCNEGRRSAAEARRSARLTSSPCWAELPALFRCQTSDWWPARKSIVDISTTKNIFNNLIFLFHSYVYLYGK